MKLSRKQKIWAVIIGIVVVYGILSETGLISKQKPQRNYVAEATALIKDLRNPTSVEGLKSDYQKAEVLYSEMKNVKDNSDAFISASMELEALTTFKDKNIEIETRKLKIKKLFSSWDGSNYKLEQYLKKHMNDPSSYQHVKTNYEIKDDKIIIYTEFRGKNAFGALVLNNAMAVQDLDGNLESVKVGN